MDDIAKEKNVMYLHLRGVIYKKKRLYIERTIQKKYYKLHREEITWREIILKKRLYRKQKKQYNK